MIYKIVPGPVAVHIKDGDYQSACNLFANIINKEAAAGWKYVSMETVTTHAQVGCFFNKQNVVKTIYMLIFCKEQ